MHESRGINRLTSPETEMVPWLAAAAWPRGQMEAWPSWNPETLTFALDLVSSIPSANRPLHLCLQSGQRDVDDDGEVIPPVTDDSCLFVCGVPEEYREGHPMPDLPGRLDSCCCRQEEGPCCWLYALSAPPAGTSSVRHCLQASWVIVAISLPLQQQGGWWQSLYGIGSVIDMITCLVIDYAVLSLYCHGCSTVGDHMDKDNDEYREWKMAHECNKNFHGTPGAMDAAFAEILWRHSEQRHGFCYVTVLSDSDAKTYNHIVDLYVYGDDCPVTKEEFVNHVSKRLGTALRKLAPEGRQEGVISGGKGYGKLTSTAIVQLQKYYGRAIRSHPNDLEGMRNALFASFFHALSTDEDPHHDRCPAGSSSRCFFHRAVAKGD
ncbi:hypothetical protein NP493_372g05029 [Ridgeia piscesae]|uniref:Mutator-like transposase domain-containing protein n=1 Tax=Ridgeia piscesae TaxID=27915 RepID=A0AAD9L3A8_RIDPI|nr:hypothetical protein NP493_372g05029 [Ridgeia piscesae]